MSATEFRDTLLPQDTAEDDSSLETNAGQPVSEAELEDALYGGDHSTAERLALLRSLRSDLSSRESTDFGEGDPAAVVGEIDDRIAELEGADAQASGNTRLDADPVEHRETLAPDSDELAELDDEDEASLDGDVEWSDPADDPEALARPEEDEP